MSPRLADPARSRIVLFGTPTHGHTGEGLPDVPQVANNITDLAAVFTDPVLGGFDADHCVPTPAGIGLDGLGEVLTKAASQAEDLLLIYYAGHGLLDRRGQLHLALADTHPDRLGFTALPYETLRAVCLDSHAAAKVVILDCCFSGRAIGQTLAGQDQQILGQLDVDGTYTLTSAPANSAALVLPGERHTAFTGRLLQLLHEGDPESGPVLSIGGIYHQLRSRLQGAGLPLPQQRGTATADLLGLVRNRRPRQPAVVKLPEEIQDGLDSRFPHMRVGAVNELADWLTSPDPARALAARNALQHVADHDNPTVARAAVAVLSTVTRVPAAMLTAAPVHKKPTHTADRATSVALTDFETSLKAHRLVSTVVIYAKKDPAQARAKAVEAERLTGTFTDTKMKARTLASVGRAWAVVDPGEARRVTVEAERVAGTLTDTGTKAQTLADVGRAWVHVAPASARRVIAEAERLTGTLTDAGTKALTLAEVGQAWTKIDPTKARPLAAEAKRLADTLSDDSTAKILIEIALWWADADAG